MNRYRVVLLVMVLALLVGLGSVSGQDSPVSIIFMHHSTGLGILQEGEVREALTERGYALWDHGYNEEGLTDAAGEWLNLNWDVPGDNTDPDGWYEIFNQPYTDPPTNTFSHMLAYDVIIFKSCFPNSDIYDDDMLAAYRDYYLSIRDVMDAHPDKIFIPWTTPPLVPNSTTPENAARAREWAAYLTSAEYLDGHPNVFPFDIFNLLADDDGFLRADYRVDEWDSHPNTLGNQTVGPIFVQFVDDVIQNFTPGESSVQPVLVDAPPDTQPADTSEPVEMAAGVPAAPGDVIDDFEVDEATLLEHWWTYVDEGAQHEVALGQPGHDSAGAMMVTFANDADQYAGFGTDFMEAQDWSAASGLSFYWYADQPDLVITLYLFVADPDDPITSTPFETHLTPPVGDWELVTLPWAVFEKPTWAGDDGTDVFDPAHITGMSFDVGNWEQAQHGTLWLDDLHLVDTP